MGISNSSDKHLGPNEKDKSLERISKKNLSPKKLKIISTEYLSVNKYVAQSKMES